MLLSVGILIQVVVRPIKKISKVRVSFSSQGGDICAKTEKQVGGRRWAEPHGLSYGFAFYAVNVLRRFRSY